MTEFEEDQIRYYGKIVLYGEKKHWCPEWDFLPIDDTCPEFQSCICYSEDKRKTSD